MRTNANPVHRGVAAGRLFPACLLALLLSTVSTARAVTVTTLPADTTVDRGSSFVLRLSLDDFPNLKAFQIISAFDPTILALQRVEAGGVLTASGRSFFGQAIADRMAPADTAWFDAAMLDGTTAGPGVLVTLTFKAVGDGTSPVPCRSADLRDASNHHVLPACLGSLVHVQEPVPVRAGTWGRLKSLYR